MLRPTALLAFMAAMGLAAPVSADCAPPNHFDHADRAALVYVARVTRVTPNTSARVAVGPVVEGTPGRERDVAFNPFDFVPEVGGRYVLFQDAAGQNLGGCPTLSLAPESLGRLGVREAGLLSALRRFVAATDGGARRALLVELATAGRTELAGQAADRLSRETLLLRAITAGERRRLVTALAGPPGAHSTPLALLAARLHALEALPSLIALLDTRGQINGRVIEDALELLTNHHQPRYRHGQDFGPDVATELQREWRAWEAAHRGRPIDAVLAEGYRERGVTPPATGDARALAALVRAAPDHLTRAVAAETLERVTGGVSEFPRWVHGIPSPNDWEEIASRNLGSLP